MGRLVLALALACAGPTVAGCAAMRAAGARHEHIESQTQEYVYQKPLSQVWPQARQLLFEEGFEVKDTDSTTAETEWKKGDSGRARYLLSGIEVDEGSCRVQFTKDEQYKTDSGWSSSDPERDLGMEWKLIKKVDPDGARKIEADADAKGDAAKAQ
jgi:hypothetical protein